MSAGTHPADRIARGAIEVASRHGLDLPDTPPRTLEPLAGEGDLMVTVCDNAHEELAGLGDVHWSVPDPLRLGTEEAFEEAFSDIAGRINDLAPRVLAA
jgi:protein-tyrosine-phosphatase